MFSKLYLVRSKVPEDVMQGYSTATNNLCAIAIFKIQVFVNISCTTKINIREKKNIYR